jgi:hypothetical protein
MVNIKADTKTNKPYTELLPETLKMVATVIQGENTP